MLLLLGTEGLLYKGFKLISIELKSDKIFGDITYNFINREDRQDSIYTTVLIGPNGTRKSRLFNKAIMILWYLYDLKNGKKPYLSEYFLLKYSMNHSIYEFGNRISENQKGFYLKVNGIEESSFKDVVLPDSIIANAIMLTDRFPFPDQEKFPIYQYLGSRYRPQLASTKTFIGRVVEFVSKNIDSDFFITGIKKITKEFLNDESEPCITFYTQNTHRFFKEKIEAKEFYSYFDEIEKRYEEKNTIPPFKLNHYKNLKKNNPEILNKVVNLCTTLIKNKKLRGFHKKSFKAITFSLVNEDDVQNLREMYILLDHMRQLGIIYPAEIEFLRALKPEKGEKYLDGYSIVDSSSGEHNLLGSMIGLIASIQPNSLIFIDEPEISLHPNWQMRFLSFLRDLLSAKELATSHIIVATHSHFLISDLDGNNSSVVVLKRDAETKKLSANLLEGKNTYGWSAEDVLYRVFSVRTTRNYYMGMELRELLHMISSKSTKKESMQQIVNRLEKVKLNENDPLNLILEKAKNYIQKI